METFWVKSLTRILLATVVSGSLAVGQAWGKVRCAIGQ